MKITRQKRSQKEFGYYLVIEIASREDEKSLIATLGYLTSKKHKAHHATIGKLIPLPKMLKDLT